MKYNRKENNMSKNIILKLINNERIIKSLLFKSCGAGDYCGCEQSADLCPSDSCMDCITEHCLCKADG